MWGRGLSRGKNSKWFLASCSSWLSPSSAPLPSECRSGPLHRNRERSQPGCSARKQTHKHTGKLENSRNESSGAGARLGEVQSKISVWASSLARKAMVAELLSDLGQALVDLEGTEAWKSERASPLTVFPQFDLLLLIASSVVTGADPIADAKANMRRQSTVTITGCNMTVTKEYKACIDAVSVDLQVCDFSKKMWQCLPTCACNSDPEVVEALRATLEGTIGVIKLVEPSLDCGVSSTWKCGSVVGFKSSAAGLHATVFTGIIASLATLLASY